MSAASWLPEGVSDAEAVVDGLRVRYLRVGTGPALLLIHGLLGYAFSWRFNLLPLAQNFTVLAPDLPGIGFSERRAGMAGDITSAAVRLEKYLGAVGAGTFHLLGTSHGGALAVFLAARLRDRVRRLVLSAPANPWSRHGRLMIPVLATRPGLHIVRAVTATAWANRWGLKRMYGDRRRVRPGTAEGYQAHIALPRTGDYVHAILRHWRADMLQFEKALQQISAIPTLLLWGERDRIVFPDSARALQERLPRSELAILPGAGHLPYEEVPEEFNRLVTRFLVQSGPV